MWQVLPTFEQRRGIEGSAGQGTQFRHRPTRPGDREPFTRLHTIHNIAPMVAKLPDGHLIHVLQCITGETTWTNGG